MEKIDLSRAYTSKHFYSRSPYTVMYNNHWDNCAENRENIRTTPPMKNKMMSIFCIGIVILTWTVLRRGHWQRKKSVPELAKGTFQRLLQDVMTRVSQRSWDA
jgi:hypothetical protein